MTTNLSDFRSTLQRLQEMKMPESLEDPNDENGDETGDEKEQDVNTLMRRYEMAREEYLKRRMEQTLYEHLKNFDGECLNLPQEPSLEEKEQLNQQFQEAQNRLQMTAERIFQRQRDVKVKYETFVQRRQEVAQMITDMEQSVFDDTEDDKENQCEEVSEQELIAEEAKCAALTKRRAELELMLGRVRHEVALKEKKLDDTKARLMEIRREEMPTVDTLSDFIAETSQMQKKVDKHQEIISWYHSLRDLMEDLVGIKVLNVTHEDDTKAILLKMQLLGRHDIEVRLLPDHRRENNLRVDNAKFLTSTIVKGGAEDSILELRIPDLLDLVRLCTKMSPKEDLRFLIRETMSRIGAITARVEELSRLRTKYLTKIGVLEHSPHSFGGEDQEIVCTVNENVTVILRLTPDCPMVSGSVFCDQIFSVGGLDQDILDNLKDAVNDMRFRGPTELMNIIKEKLGQLH